MILVTGAGGQVGTELLARAAQHGHDVTGLVRADLDISDAAAVQAAVAKIKPSLIVNAAAYTAVDKAEEDRDAAYAINRDGPANLAAAAKEAGIPLIHISTDYVFDGSKDGAYLESDPVAPLGVYGASKEAGEQAVRAVLDEHVIMRTSWVYAAHGASFVKPDCRRQPERLGHLPLHGRRPDKLAWFCRGDFCRCGAGLGPPPRGRGHSGERLSDIGETANQFRARCV